jgi:hypothetical protein
MTERRNKELTKSYTPDLVADLKEKFGEYDSGTNKVGSEIF